MYAVHAKARSDAIMLLSRMQVTEVRETDMDLSNGQTLPYGVCLWSAGNRSRDITLQIFRNLEGQKPYAAPRPEMQKLAVDPYLRIIGAKNAFAVGDCARIVTAPLPPTAQVCSTGFVCSLHVHCLHCGRLLTKYVLHRV